MKVVKRKWMWWCDEICVEFVKVFTQPMGDHDNNANRDHGYYGKQFQVNDNTLEADGCDDC